jgi:ribose 1,5-bisphosphokinase
MESVTPETVAQVPRLPVPCGVFVAVVGPSGAGKDTLIRYAWDRLSGEPSVVFVRRVITRAMDGTGENHDTVDVEEFDRREQNGEFALSWEAHGLRYGLPAGIDASIRSGMVAVANLSRAIVPLLGARYANVRVVRVTASPATLAARLAARGRENGGEIRGRIARSSDAALVVDGALVVDNDGPPEKAGERLIAIIRSSIRRTAERS